MITILYERFTNICVNMTPEFNFKMQLEVYEYIYPNHRMLNQFVISTVVL